MNLNEQVEKIFRSVLDSEVITKLHGPGVPSYRSLAVEVSISTDSVTFEWRAYPGGDFPGGCVYAPSVEELLYKIEGYDPAEAKRREIRALKAQLARLECDGELIVCEVAK